MGLIDVVKRAQNLSPLDAQGAGLCGLKATWVRNEDAPLTKVVNSELVSWRGVPAVSEHVNLRQEKEEQLIFELQAKADDSLSIVFLEELLRSYFEQVVNPNPNFYQTNASEENTSGFHPPCKKQVASTHFLKLLKKASPVIGQKLLSLTLRACLICKDFIAVTSILDSHALSGNTYPDLVQTLIEHDQVALLCSWVREIGNPRFSDLLLVLKYFLKSSLWAGESLAKIHNQWQQRAATAIAKLSQVGNARESIGGEIKPSLGDGDDVNGSARTKKMNFKEDAIFKALFLSAAFDGFQPYELCLHYLVSSGHDEAVLTAILSQLNNTEVLKLLCYLRKWLEKCSSRGSLCTHHSKLRDLIVPSLADILQWVSILADVHLMSFILCSDFHTEIALVQLLIKGLVDFGHKLAPLVGVTEHLRTKGALPAQASSHGEDEHVIEYLEI